MSGAVGVSQLVTRSFFRRASSWPSRLTFAVVVIVAGANAATAVAASGTRMATRLPTMLSALTANKVFFERTTGGAASCS